MKAIKLANLCIIALALTVAAVGCKKKPTAVTPLPGQKGYVGDGTGTGLPPGGTTGGSSDVDYRAGALADPTNFANMKEDRSALADYTVYFDFDSSTVKASELDKVVSVAQFINGNMKDAVRVAGYCDERGTEGYNLALGERRALALREALVEAGVSSGRIDTISYGEEYPANPAHDEIAWAENRRGVFILLLP